GQTGNNLFVAAKRHGYQTAFVSVQKLDGLSSLMGGRMLDHWLDAVDRPIEEGWPDAELIERVRQVPMKWDLPFLLTLTTRPGHTPDRDNLPDPFAKFSRQEAVSTEQAIADEYDDAVRWFDLQMTRTHPFILAQARRP